MYIELVEFLKKNIRKNITIKEILAHIPLPRKTLYRYIERAM